MTVGSTYGNNALGVISIYIKYVNKNINLYQIYQYKYQFISKSYHLQQIISVFYKFSKALWHSAA